MVYDTPRNFIGESHYAQGQELQEGDELDLDKGGAIVQVSEPVSHTETDLTELLQKRDKKASNNNSSSPLRAPASRLGGTAPTPYAKHRSLNTLLGTPKGRIGKAVIPTKSPFELRHFGQENQRIDIERSPKRRKTESWNVVRTTNVLNERSSNDCSRRASTIMPVAGTRQKDQSQLGAKEVINLCSDEVEATTLSSSGVSHAATGRETNRQNMIPPLNRQSVSQSRGVQQRKTLTAGASEQVSASLRLGGVNQTRDRDNAVSEKATKDRQATRSPSPAVRTANRMSAREDTPDKQRPDEPSHNHILVGSPRHSGATLKLMGNAPRKMLLCQNRPAARKNTSADPEDAILAKERHPTDRERALTLHSSEPLQEARTSVKKSAIQAESKKQTKQLSDSTSAKRDDGTAHDAGENSQSRAIERQRRLRRKLKAFDLSDSEGESTHDNTEKVLVSRTTLGDPQEVQVDAVEECPAQTMPPPSKPRQGTRRAGDPVRVNKKPSQKQQSRSTSTEVNAIPSASQTASTNLRNRLRERVEAETTHAPSKSRIEPEATVPESALERQTFTKRRSPPKPTTRLDLNAGGDPLSKTLLARPYKAPSNAARKYAQEAENVRVEAKKEADKGAWSREAIDLFDWRPPGWDEVAGRIGSEVELEVNGAGGGGPKAPVCV